MSRSVACNLETGICEVNLDLDLSNYEYKAPVIKDKVLVEYFTDPLCTACFVFDPTLEEMKSLYGDQIEFKIVLGGMLEKHHRNVEEDQIVADNIERMGSSFNMPMSGKLMRERPIDSSYPSSLAYLAVLRQDRQLGEIYLRRLREAVYVEDRDVSKETVLIELVTELGLDEEQFMIDFYSPEVLDEFENHIAYTIMNGVRGFPSVVVYGLDGKSTIIRGVNDIGVFKDILEKHGLIPDQKKEYTIDNVLESTHYLSLREIFDRLDIYFDDEFEDTLRRREDVEIKELKNGSYYRLNR